jgi:hypothetical protein
MFILKEKSEEPLEKPRGEVVFERNEEGMWGGGGRGRGIGAKCQNILSPLLIFNVHYQNIFRNTFSVYIQYRRHTQQVTESIFYS